MSSAGAALRFVPISSSTWFTASAEEWMASVSIALEPDIAAAVNFDAATSTLPINAAYTTFVDESAMRKPLIVLPSVA